MLFVSNISEFKPEYKGKFNFDINTVKKKIEGNEDKLTIGILLYKTVLQCALQGITASMGIPNTSLLNLTPKIKKEIPAAET